MFESRYTISIDLREPSNNGTAQIVFRCQQLDRDLITAAAKLIGISVNSFMRTVMVQAAHQVMKESDHTPEVPRDNVKFVVSDSVLPPGVKPNRR